MTKNSPQGPIPREALQRWLNTGNAPLTVEDGSGSLVTVLKLSKTPEIDYLYGASARRAEGISWGSDLQSLQFVWTDRGSIYCLAPGPGGIYQRGGGIVYREPSGGFPV